MNRQGIAKTKRPINYSKIITLDWEFMHRSLSLTENTMLKKTVRLKFKYGFNTISKS